MRKALSISLGAALLALAALALHLTVLHARGNLHEVISGELYRSAQPGEGDLGAIVRRYGIASVLNLRGAAPGQAWYETERAEAERLGLVHADFAMSASRAIGQEEAERLIDLMRDMPKPLLVHCRHGADRTGLAVALYLAAIAGAGERAAEAALSIRYGHFAVPYLSDAWPMDQSFETLEPWLGFDRS